MFLTGEGGMAVPEVVDEAMAAAPAGVAAGGAILPRERRVSEECRICGQAMLLSREHVPPRSAGNLGTSRAHSLPEWLARESLDEVPGGRFEQGGIWGYTLCGACNSRTGRFSHEYRRWAFTTKGILREEVSDSIEKIDQSPITKGVSVRLPAALPGAFVRQVLSVMCSVAGPWRVTDQHPELRAALLDGDMCELPPGLALGMALCAGPSALVAGPSLVMDTSSRWKWIAVLAFPPLAFELELAASADRPPSVMCEIGNFLQVRESTRADVDLDLIIGFSHTVLPGDWRTRCQIERKLGLDGLPEAESAW
jgi:hypothetical protein